MSLKTKKQMKGNRGITLIALVITIIVLLILAGITIAALTGENGILNKAAEAKIQTGVGEEKEQIALAYHAAMIETQGNPITAQDLQNQINLNGVTATVEEADGSIKVTFATTGNVYSLDSNGNIEKYEPSEIEKAKTEGTVFADNTTITDGYGNEVKIPAGFKIANDSADDVTGGIVVEDATYEGTMGSQFVWIPVGTVYANKGQTESKTINLDRYEFASDGTPTPQGTATINSNYQELATSTSGNATAKNLENFLNNTRTNGGYYFGRYEAGVQNGTLDTSDMLDDWNAPNTNWTGYTGDNIQLVCKAGEQAWNYATQNKASELSRNMYSNGKFESDLVNSYAWDTAIVYIQEFSGDSDYSRQNRLQTTEAKTGEATDGTNKDVRCNIYDMAGNMREWTTETSSNSDSPCVHRGGIYYYSDSYTSVRSINNMTNARSRSSFRPLLYW